MLMLTRSRRIRRAWSFVWRRLPVVDQRDINKLLTRVCSLHEYSTGAGINMERSEASAGLYPLYASLEALGGPSYRGQILFYLPVCRKFTDTGLVGIVAHELGHAKRAVDIGEGWHEKMQADYANEEKW